MKFLNQNRKIDDIHFLLDEIWKLIYRNFSFLLHLKSNLEPSIINIIKTLSLYE